MTLNCRCAWEGCANAGEYRAPRDRRLTEYVHFCLDHVRAYNASWDFHAGLGTDQIEAEIRSAATWERPTWKLGTMCAGSYANRFYAHDPFEFASDTAFGPRKTRGDKRERASQKSTERHSALDVLQLTAPITLDQLKRRYKALVKQYHPDANGGSRAAEDRMKAINEAYQSLRAEFATAS